jgi:hypothetical protein
MILSVNDLSWMISVLWFRSKAVERVAVRAKKHSAPCSHLNNPAS